MPEYTQGDTRPVLQPADIAAYQANGSLVLDSRRTRPLWFDGRFLAARDFSREQNYFLQREADLARSPGFDAIRGLLVTIPASNGQTSAAQSVTIGAGHGVTPAGELVTVPGTLTLQLSDLPEEETLDPRLGEAASALQSPDTRTGLYVLALKPVQFTANPITAYPTTVQGTRTTHDADFVEATAIVLVPYPSPLSTTASTTQLAAIARQVFTSASSSAISESLLPLALLSLQDGTLQWLDTYMVRREPAAGLAGLQFGLTDVTSEQGFLLEYDSQLQQAVATLSRQNLPAKFAATDYFQALPPVGRFPLNAINTSNFTQAFFPAEIDVRLSVVPSDELASLLEDALSQPAIDLTADPSTYSNLTIFAMVPVPRSGFAALVAALPAVQLTTILPHVLSNRRPIELLQFYRGVTGIQAPSGADNNAWQAAFGTQTYGYYMRRPSSATPVAYTALIALVLSTLAPDTVIAGAPDTTVSVTGSGFNAQTIARWDETSLATTVNSPTRLTATVPASLLSKPGSASFQLIGPDEVSPSLPFLVAPALSSSALSPNTIVAESAAFTLTVSGTGFMPAAVVFLNGAALATIYASDTELTATVTADLIKLPLTASVTVQGAGQTSGALPLQITPAPLVLNSISPTGLALGSGHLQLNANGSGFFPGAAITWNGNALPSTFVSDVLLQASVPDDALVVGTFQVSVAISGETSPAPLTFTITPPAPTINVVAPSYVIVGGKPFTIAVIGTNFVAGTVILWNGKALATNVTSATELDAAITNDLFASAGNVTIAASTPGAGTSAIIPFAVLAPLTITSLAPDAVTAGGSAFLLTVNGTGFFSGTALYWKVINANGTPEATALQTPAVINANLMTATVPASLISISGAAAVYAQLDSAEVSPDAPFTVGLAPINLTSATPGGVWAGSPAFTIALTGAGFSTSTVFAWNGTPLIATVTDGDHATVTVPANFVDQTGMAMITAADGTQVSGSLDFAIEAAPVMTISTISPTVAIAGGAAFTLIVNGSSFATSAVVTFNGNALATTFNSASQLEANVPAALFATAGIAQVTVTGPPGQASPQPVTLNVVAQLTISALRPATLVAGSNTFTLTVIGAGFDADTVLLWRMATATGTVSTSQLSNISILSPETMTAVVDSSLVSRAGTAGISAQQESVQASNQLPFTVAPSKVLPPVRLPIAPRVDALSAEPAEAAVEETRDTSPETPES